MHCYVRRRCTAGLHGGSLAALGGETESPLETFVTQTLCLRRTTATARRCWTAAPPPACASWPAWTTAWLEQRSARRPRPRPPSPARQNWRSRRARRAACWPTAAASAARTRRSAPASRRRTPRVCAPHRRRRCARPPRARGPAAGVRGARRRRGGPGTGAMRGSGRPDGAPRRLRAA